MFLSIFVAVQIPGDPPLSLVAAWALCPERLHPESPLALRNIFRIFHESMDLPVAPPQLGLGQGPQLRRAPQGSDPEAATRGPGAGATQGGGGEKFYSEREGKGVVG
ncbi:unnamed protein product, partial [Discosporangium mesarthrocarpum]